jgi:hypothetical protein
MEVHDMGQEQNADGHLARGTFLVEESRLLWPIRSLPCCQPATLSALRGIMVSIEVTESANKISSFKQVSTFQKLNAEISKAKPNTDHKGIKTSGAVGTSWLQSKTVLIHTWRL